MFHEYTGEPIDEMKTHKLMYFAQRESLMEKEEPLFDGTFYGYKYGPVLKEIREEFKKEHPFADVPETKSKYAESVLKKVLDRYGKLSAWKLSGLSHREFSWKMARKGMDSKVDGDVSLDPAAMKIDAIKERIERRSESA